MSSTSHVVLALSVYVEPLVSDARVVIAGPPDSHTKLAEQLRALGARSVHVYDADAADLDVRDGAFDVAVIPDLGVLHDPAVALRRIRRVVDPSGSVVAMGRARLAEDESRSAPFADVAPAAVAYAELYDLFALQFEHVTMSGVVPFAGVVFAELGTEEDVAVSVDTRLIEPPSPRVFVVVASHGSDRDEDLDPYAIVQVPDALRDDREDRAAADAERARETAFATTQLRADFAGAQLEQALVRVAELEQAAARVPELEAAVRRLAELDVAALRIAELEQALADAEEIERVAVAAQQAITVLERRIQSGEQGILERDDRIAALRGELDALRREGEELAAAPPAAGLEAAVARAERAEAMLALHVADLAHVAEAHATETSILETQLRDRARVIASMEKELSRREQLVRELAWSLEESREEGTNGVRFEAAPAPVVDAEETARLRRKLDELAMDIARREGELVAQSWRIKELEKGGATSEGGPLEDEIDALRQALTQEHAARVAAESGEELTRARAELARQSVLLQQLEQMRP